MNRIRHTPEQIIRKIREAEAELAKGIPSPRFARPWASPRTSTTAHAISGRQRSPGGPS
jgi:hypothetical protein